MPAIVVFNKIDTRRRLRPAGRPAATAKPPPVVYTSAVRGQGLLDLRQALLDKRSGAFHRESRDPGRPRRPRRAGRAGGAHRQGGAQRPPDPAAGADHPRPPGHRRHGPRGQGARAAQSALARLNRPPKLVVTDSQAFLKVAADTPREIPMTSFSILFARFKGDLTAQVEGALAIEQPAARRPHAHRRESCSHHPIADDIGRVKIPRWLNAVRGRQAGDRHGAGPRLPRGPVALPAWWSTAAPAPPTGGPCSTASCAAGRPGVPITNYGLAIAYILGIFERALEPFPAALEIVRNAPSPDLAGGDAGEHHPAARSAGTRGAPRGTTRRHTSRRGARRRRVPHPRRDPLLARRDRPRPAGRAVAPGRRNPTRPTWATRCTCAG